MASDRLECDAGICKTDSVITAAGYWRFNFFRGPSTSPPAPFILIPPPLPPPFVPFFPLLAPASPTRWAVYSARSATPPAGVERRAGSKHPPGTAPRGLTGTAPAV